MTLLARAPRRPPVFTVLLLVVIYIAAGAGGRQLVQHRRTFGWPPPGLTLHWWELAAAQRAPGTRC